MAVPAGAYPASPIPMAPRVASNWGKVLVKAQANVAMLHRKAMMPMVFFRLQRSTRIDTGRTKATIDQ